MNIDTMVKQLLEAKEAYYNSDTQIMSDKEFDTLEEKLRELEPDNEYFSIVGAKASGEKIQHRITMLSMGKAKIPSDVIKWLEKLDLDNSTNYLIQPKIDGISATCCYKNGILSYVSTRGDGQSGQDITHIADFIADIPKSINFCNEEIEIRGELYLPKDTKLDIEGKPLRNRCAGLINRKEDLNDIKYIRFICYQIASINKSLFKSESSKIKTLAKEGFHTVEFWEFKDFRKVEEIYNVYLNIKRDEWLYETDGLIITVDDNAMFEEIDSRWVVDHHHHYAIALKPPSEQRETELIDIEWQVSRLGSIIPVAIFKPVIVGGAKIERASLHNALNVKELKLAVGDLLLIERSNDVIPTVIENRSSNARDENFIHPLLRRSCPSCDNKLEEYGVHIRCTNKKCSEQFIQKLLFWVKESGIEQVAEATLRKLVEVGKIKAIKDLYSLNASDFEDIEGFAEKKIKNFISEVKRCKRMSAQDLIAKLGIPLVQKKSLKRLNISSIDDFLNFNDCSYVIGEKIIEWKDEPANIDLLNELVQEIEIDEIIEDSLGELCMTGKGPFGRKELTKIFTDKGWQVVSSVTKETKLLVTDDTNGSSSKLAKARKYGIEITSYDKLLS